MVSSEGKGQNGGAPAQAPVSDKKVAAAAAEGKAATRTKRPLSAAGFVVPVLASVAHAAYLWSVRDGLKAEYVATGGNVQLSWLVPVGMAVAYLVALRGSMAWMAGREATDPREAMIVYNVYMTAMSYYMGATLFVEGVLSGNWGWSVPVDRTAAGAEMAYVLWVNYQSKFVEFMDTAFMVARKANKQISFLHVSHHAEMGGIMYILVTQAPGGVSYFPPMINSFIHTVMYFYYALTAVGIRVPWKKYITVGQLAQFVVVMAHAVWQLVNFDTAWPAAVSVISFLLMIQMLFMFGDFFTSEYSGGKAAAAAAGGDKKARSD